MAPRTSKRSTEREADPILALTTGSTPVGKVSVDDVVYDMVDPAHFTLRQVGHIERAMERVKTLEAKKAPTEKDDADYNAALRALAGQACPDVPGDAWRKVGTGQLADLAVAFFGLVALRSPRLSLLKRLPPNPSAGRTPLRTSRGSTGQPQSAGTG